MKAQVHMLSDWPEDRLPVCAAADCAQNIANGDKYVILPDTIKLVCLPCARNIADLPEIPDEFLPPSPEAKLTKPKRVRVYTPKPRAVKQPTPPKPKREAGPRAYVVDAAPESVSLPAPPPPRTKADPRSVLCAWCGSVVAGRGGVLSVLRFCNVYCAGKHRKKKYEELRPSRMITCARIGCEQTFVPYSNSRGKQKFCSVACAGRHTKGFKQAVCFPCGRTFEPNRLGQKFCSPPCRFYGNKGRLNPNPGAMAWTHAYDKCIRCGTTERMHVAGGECSRCYVPKRSRIDDQAARRIEMGRRASF